MKHNVYNPLPTDMSLEVEGAVNKDLCFSFGTHNLCWIFEYMCIYR